MSYLKPVMYIGAIFLLFLFQYSCSRKIIRPPVPVQMDMDNDGVSDSMDICPEVAGSASTNGCPDTDGDGVIDSNDKCPTQAGLPVTGGCPDLDKDGIPDAEDKCPGTAGPNDNQGCPDEYTGAEGPGEDSSIVKHDSTVSVIDSAAAPNPRHPIRSPAGVTTNDDNIPTLPLPDTAANTNEIHPGVNKASIAYSFENKLKKGDQMLIQMLVQLDKPVEDVEAILKAKIKEDKPVETNHTASTIVKHIVLDGYKYFYVVPSYDTAVFFIEAETPLKRELFKEKTTSWMWRVTAKKETTRSYVVLKVWGISNTNDTAFVDNGEIPISVFVEPARLPSYWIYMSLSIVCAILLFILFRKKILAAMRKKLVYFSYSWNAEKELVQKFYSILDNDKDIDVIRDKEDLRQRALITKFMNEIAKANFVVVILSDDYLRSRYCMYELDGIYVNSNSDKNEFSKKLFPLLVEDINLSDPNIRNMYASYWKAEDEKWKKEARENVSEENTRQSRNITRISNDVTEILGCIADIITPKLQNHEKENFASIKEEIKKLVKENSKK